MAYTGVIIGLDLASATGVAEGCPGEIPKFDAPRLRIKDDSHAESFGRALGYLAERIAAPRSIGNRIYGPGEAANEGMVRVAIEAPIKNPTTGNTNADAQLITKGLWACCMGFAHRRGVMVRDVTVGQVRKAFIGSGREQGDAGKRMARQMCVGLGWNPPTLDCSDAGAVWWWACNQWNPAVTPRTEPFFSKVRWEA